MNKIDKLPDEYIDASIVATLLWDKIGEIIEWQNEMVDLMLNTSSVIHTLDGRLSQLEANTPQEPVDNKVDNKKTQVDDTHRTVTLRIPKGKTIAEAVAWALFRFEKDEDITGPASISDTDLQKALDEVQPNE